jgi:hypothetical protein
MPHPLGVTTIFLSKGNKRACYFGSPLELLSWIGPTGDTSSQGLHILKALHGKDAVSHIRA